MLLRPTTVQISLGGVLVLALGVVAGALGFRHAAALNDLARSPWIVAAGAALLAWLLFGLPLAVVFFRRREAGQRVALRNLSEAMEQSRSAIVILGLDRRIQYANRGFCNQLGYAREEMIGRPWRDCHALEGAEALLPEAASTVRSAQPWEGEWINRRKDGSVYPARGGITPVRQGDGALACFVAVFDDVTEVKRREAELREARDQAQAGDRAKGHFLATMSHEVRTPLNGIVGFSSLLLETSLTTEQREFVHTIRMSTEALIQLTGDILDFARIESGKLKLDPLACDPRECIEDALDLHAAKAAGKGLELLHHIAADVPAAVVTDGGRLRQVLVNLIGNAVKFTERGEVAVSVRRLPVGAAEVVAAEADACFLEFTVRDSGIGITGENQAKLFRPFSQVDESTTRRYGGTGLGLAICRNLVELMGGKISMESQPGQGTTLRFTIHAPAAAAVPPVRDLGGVRVGLAIGSVPLRRELADLVRSWQGSVVEVESLEKTSSLDADIVLVEVGADAAGELAAQPERRTAFPPEKLLALVPISLANVLRSGLRAHFRLLVNKPVHHDALFALLAGSWGAMPTVQPPTHFGFRVLVVEDNMVNQRLVQRVLANLGCATTAAENGRQAVELLTERAADFDLVLLDLHMPELDGLGALREIRAGRAGRPAQTIWIIALTADVRDEQRDRGMADGLNDYLTKPLKLPELEAALRKFRTHRVSRKR